MAEKKKREKTAADAFNEGYAKNTGLKSFGIGDGNDRDADKLESDTYAEEGKKKPKKGDAGY